MSETVGYATLQIIPSMRGTQAALASGMAAPSASVGKTAGSKMGSSMLAGVGKFAGPMAAVFGGVALAGIVKDSVDLEKQFSQTMNTLGAVADVPKKQLGSLSDLALKMGADTVFSANEAADAMLELGKGGLSAATIQSGALEGTLTLAAAGGTDLATAATIASNALNTFGLEGKDMAGVADALAGGANASSASVESLAQALQQVGPGATQAGLDLQTTVGALSAFDAAGIKGSDAGTSLKTFLTRLVPATDRAATGMKRLGVDATDAHGNFLPLTDIAGQLSKGMEDLTDKEKTAALNMAFGSDASRAAIVLSKEGADGLQKYIDATSKSGSAQKVAAARMDGTAGALEALSGSVETAKLALGQLLAPVVVAGAKALSGAVNWITEAIQGLTDGGKGGKASAFMTQLSKVWEKAGKVIRKIWPDIQKAVEDAWTQLQPLFKKFGDFMTTQILPGLRLLLPIIGKVIVFLVGKFLPAFVNSIKGIWRAISGFVNFFQGILNAVISLLRGDFSGAWDGVKQAIGGFVDFALGILQIFWNSTPMLLLRTGLSFIVKPIWSTLKAIGRFFASVFHFVVKVVGQKLSDMRETISRVLGAVKAVWSKVFGFVKGFASRVWGDIKRIFSTAFSFIRTLIRTQVQIWIGIWKLLMKIKDFIFDLWQRVGEIVRNAFGKVIEFIREKIAAWIGFFADLGGKVLDKVKDFGTLLFDSGKAIVQGLIDGIENMAGALWDKITSMGDGIKDKFKSILGINSPSKVFMAYGEGTVEGFVKGVGKRKGDADKAIAGAVTIPRSATIAGRGSFRDALDAAGGGTPVHAHLHVDGKKMAETVFEIGGRQLAHGKAG